MLRYLVTDTPGQVTATTPKQVLSDDTRVPLRVEVRDKEYKPVTNAKVQARFMGPDGATRHHGTGAATARRGRLQRANGRPKSPALTWPRSSPAASRKRSGATC